MNANEFQQLAGRTFWGSESMTPLDNDEICLLWNAIGVAGEAGEFVDAIKKMIFHKHGIDDNVIKDELGDILWYIAAVCSARGIELADVMEQNVAKLQARYPQGFSFEDSQHG